MNVKIIQELNNIYDNLDNLKNFIKSIQYDFDKNFEQTSNQNEIQNRLDNTIIRIEKLKDRIK